MTLKSSAVGSKDAGYLQGMFQDLEAAEALRCVCWLGDLVRKRVHVDSSQAEGTSSVDTNCCSPCMPQGAPLPAICKGLFLTCSALPSTTYWGYD